MDDTKIQEQVLDQWVEFVKFVIEKHHLLPDYEPDLSSILMWEEFKRSKLIPPRRARFETAFIDE